MDEKTLGKKFRALAGVLDERSRRLWAAAEAEAIGWGGVSKVARATGLSRTTIGVGLNELSRASSRRGKPISPGTKGDRLRAAGAGRKTAVFKDAELLGALDRLVDPATRGDPESPLRWTSKSTQRLAEELTRQGHRVSARTVAKLLDGMDYSLQANRKVREGSKHPDRNQQFEYISEQVQQFHRRGQPVISVDTKKKEVVGRYRNAGVEWRPKASPEEVNDHDFPDPKKGKAVPYGIYEIASNQGWVNVGTDHDTPEFAVQSIRSWWLSMGKPGYPNAEELLVTADGGGSNGYRVRAWKTNLQRLADETGLKISVCHLPPGTSKWNKIEHRMFCHITKNWRGRPLESYEAVVSLIGATTTKQGLRIEARLDPGSYEKGVKISDKELARIRIARSDFHGEWNYTIIPATN
jgi:hypothetical protein